MGTVVSTWAVFFDRTAAERRGTGEGSTVGEPREAGLGGGARPDDVSKEMLYKRRHCRGRGVDTWGATTPFYTAQTLRAVLRKAAGRERDLGIALNGTSGRTGSERARISSNSGRRAILVKHFYLHPKKRTGNGVNLL